MPWKIIIHGVNNQVATLGSRAPPSLAAVWRRTRDLSVRVAGLRSPEPERMTLFGSTLRTHGLVGFPGDRRRIIVDKETAPVKGQRPTGGEERQTIASCILSGYNLA